MKLLGICSLVFLALGIAAYAVLAYALLALGSTVHPDMKVAFLANEAGIYTHIFASALALFLGPFQFMARLRQRLPQVHRWSGRIYLGVGVLVGGLSGLYMATFAFGGLVAKLGFSCLAVLWLYTGYQALSAIRRGAVLEHRKWMIRNFSLTFAAVTLRIYLPVSMISGIPFELAYPAIAWLCWVPNLLVAERFFVGVPGNSFEPKPLRGAA